MQSVGCRPPHQMGLVNSTLPAPAKAATSKLEPTLQGTLIAVKADLEDGHDITLTGLATQN